MCSSKSTVLGSTVWLYCCRAGVALTMAQARRTMRVVNSSMPALLMWILSLPKDIPRSTILAHVLANCLICLGSDFLVGFFEIGPWDESRQEDSADLQLICQKMVELGECPGCFFAHLRVSSPHFPRTHIISTQENEDYLLLPEIPTSCLVCWDVLQVIQGLLCCSSPSRVHVHTNFRAVIVVHQLRRAAWPLIAGIGISMRWSKEQKGCWRCHSFSRSDDYYAWPGVL